MTFPFYVTHAAVSQPSLTTTHIINIPAHLKNDVLILDMVFVPGNIGAVFLEGLNGAEWETIADNNHPNNSVQQIVWMLRAKTDQSATTVNLVISDARAGSSICAVFRAVDTNRSVEVAAQTGTSNMSDPPQLAPSWGSGDTLWLATAANIDVNNTILSSPLGYTFLEYVITGGNDGHHLIINYLQANAVSENPSAYLLTNSNDWSGITLALSEQIFNFDSSPLVNRRFVTFAPNPKLDLSRYVGKRTEKFIFQWIDGITGQIFGYLHPKADSVTLSHNTESSIKRQLDLELDFNETSQVNIIRDRILPFIVIDGISYPLGRYMFTDDTQNVKSEGNFGSYTLLDESFAIDTELDAGWSPQGRSIPISIRQLLSPIPFIRTRIEPSPFDAIGSFAIATSRLSVLETYEELGDYFPFWMDHEGVLRMIRTKDPAVEVPDFSYDDNPSIVPGIAKTTDLFTRPNRFVVIGDTNNSSSQPIVGRADIPSSAPHSIQNRGFVVPKIDRKSVSSVGQATAIARNLALRDTVIENLEFDTPLDPRHDSYNVLHLLGENWLEYAWSMDLRAGGRMSHSARRFYR